MKKLVLTLGLVVAVVLVSFAQSNETMQQKNKMEQKTDPKKIKFEETPTAVQTAFKKSEYEKESIKEVHEVSEGMKKYYKVVVDVESKKWALKYDDQGNLLETKEAK